MVVGCHSPREGLEDGAAVSVTEAWILGMCIIAVSVVTNFICVVYVVLPVSFMTCQCCSVL